MEKTQMINSADPKKSLQERKQEAAPSSKDPPSAIAVCAGRASGEGGW